MGIFTYNHIRAKDIDVLSIIVTEKVVGSLVVDIWKYLEGNWRFLQSCCVYNTTTQAQLSYCNIILDDIHSSTVCVCV